MAYVVSQTSDLTCQAAAYGQKWFGDRAQRIYKEHQILDLIHLLTFYTAAGGKCTILFEGVLVYGSPVVPL